MSIFRPCRSMDFYPRSPRGERHGVRDMVRPPGVISIHAPREGSDCQYVARYIVKKQFLSTLPARGATNAVGVTVIVSEISIHAPREGSDIRHIRDNRTGAISIHAPREGSDASVMWRASLTSNFYPRSPRGERLPGLHQVPRPEQISIHAPREGSDKRHQVVLAQLRHFYPRSPRGERRLILRFEKGIQIYFYPRSPRGERLRGAGLFPPTC